MLDKETKKVLILFILMIILSIFGFKYQLGNSGIVFLGFAILNLFTAVIPCLRMDIKDLLNKK